MSTCCKYAVWEMKVHLNICQHLLKLSEDPHQQSYKGILQTSTHIANIYVQLQFDSGIAFILVYQSSSGLLHLHQIVNFCFHVLSPKGLISDNHLIWLRLQRRQAPASNCFLEFLKGKHNHNHNQGKHGFARHKPNHYTQYSCWNWHEFGSTSLKFRQDE